MKILTVIIGLSLMISSFFVSSQTLTCEVDNTKIKPVFMNGMRNSLAEATYSAGKMRIELIKLYSSKRVENVYVAYNKNEFIVNQVGEVSYQYLLDVVFTNEYSTDESYITKVKRSLKNFLISWDKDAEKHKDNISSFIEDDGYKLMITSHSQGNIYFNILYDTYLKDFLDEFRLVSVGSPVSVNAPKTHATMIVEKSDPIKIFNGLGDFHNSGSSNATNINYTGHSFKNYVLGADTKKQMRYAYNNYLYDLVPKSSDKLNITATSSSNNVEFMASEIYSENPRTIHANSTYENSQYEQLALPIKGSLTREGNKATYSIGCNSLGENLTTINMSIWNKSGDDLDVLIDYSGLYNDSVSDTSIYESSVIERYEGVGNQITIENNGDDTFTIH